MLSLNSRYSTCFSSYSTPEPQSPPCRSSDKSKNNNASTGNESENRGNLLVSRDSTCTSSYSPATTPTTISHTHHRSILLTLPNTMCHTHHRSLLLTLPITISHTHHCSLLLTVPIISAHKLTLTGPPQPNEAGTQIVTTQ